MSTTSSSKKEQSQLIGQGTYGCVFKPSFPCYKNTNIYNNSKARKSLLVSKIFKHEQAYDEELETMKVMNKIDKKGLFTLPLIKSCEMLLKPSYSKSVKDCKHIKMTSVRHLHETYQLIYENGSMNVYDYIMKNYNNYDILDYVNTFTTLISGLVKLNKNKICHRDIKETNIKIKNKKMYLIDFGLCVKYEDIYTYEYKYVLKHIYLYYPPEFRICYNIMKNKGNNKRIVKKQLLDNCLINYESDLALFNIIDYSEDKMNLDMNNYVDDLLKQYNKQSCNEDALIKSILETSCDKIDVFSLGIVMLCFYEGHKSNNNKYSTPYDIFRYQFINLIKECVHFNPEKRISSISLFERINQLNSKIKKINSEENLSSSKRIIKSSYKKRHQHYMNSPSIY